MLRKISHIILSAFLLVSTIGFTISMHYCEGKLVSTSINKETKSCCNGKGGCCENKSFHFEIKDNYVTPVFINNDKIAEVDMLLPLFIASDAEALLKSAKTSRIFFFNSSPPPTIQMRLSLLQTYLC